MLHEAMMNQELQEPELHSLSVRVDREMYMALQDAAKRHDRPVAAQIRRFIQAGIDRETNGDETPVAA